MKLQEPANTNYAATVVAITRIVPLDNCDNVVGTPIFGFQAIVGNDTKVGDLGIVFPAETQLSEEYARLNNLHRHAFNFERAILDLWDTRAARRSAIQIDPITLAVSASRARTSDTGTTYQKEPAPAALGSGSLTTQSVPENGKTDIESNTRPTNASGVPAKISKSEDTPNASITSPSTESQSSGTNNITIDFAAAVSYVRSGGKFSSWITTMIPEKSVASFAEGATSHSVGLEILSRVCDELSLTSKDKAYLFEKHSLNSDVGARGYLEDNRRIKALKFRGHRSDCLFMPMSSLGFTGADLSQLKPGDTFDTLNNHPICQKYVIKRPSSGSTRIEKNKAKVFCRVDEKFLPEHYDTDNFFRNRDAIPSNKCVVVTQKLHGTSIRIGNTIVLRKMSLRERVAAKFGVKVQRTEFANVYGSRTVIRDVNNPYQNSYYSSDLWSAEGKKLDAIVPENYIVYGELIGWTPDGAAIQKNYTYRVPQGTCELYVYRVAVVNGQGRIVDLSWGQVKEFCLDLGLRHVPELWQGLMEDLVVEDFIDKTFNHFIGVAVPLAKESPCDEGVCVRVDGLAPYILKAKSPAFLRHETKMLDQEVIDLEEDGSS